MRCYKRASGFIVGGALTIALSAFAPLVYAQGAAGGGAGGGGAGAAGGAMGGGGGAAGGTGSGTMGMGGGANTGTGATSPGSGAVPSTGNPGSAAEGFTGNAPDYFSPRRSDWSGRWRFRHGQHEKQSDQPVRSDESEQSGIRIVGRFEQQ